MNRGDGIEHALAKTVTDFVADGADLGGVENLGNLSLTLPRQQPVGLDMVGTLMASEEFDAIEEWDEHHNYELIHGVLVVAPIALEAEVGPNEMLGHWRLSHEEHHPEGKTLNGKLPERHVRTADSRRRADRLIWTGLDRPLRPREDVPTIVVESVSAGKRDRHQDYVQKRQEYLALGIKEHWIIDRFQRTLTVWRTAPSGAEEQVVSEGEIYMTGLLPGFELPLAQLLGVADRWAE